ncbi:hypothetical protein T4D_14336 [Trichinella pseudospiralis]|uniref:Uncharacterized protein n=1 Tax=Trichinella pseudospiralis TaxID=6337 RepID=A0A0V1ELV4_TRIPS|nr:hypothetical protein T4D_14336 [Trichinella pseudospiralis]
MVNPYLVKTVLSVLVNILQTSPELLAPSFDVGTLAKT